jgi:hypothetical protein
VKILAIVVFVVGTAGFALGAAPAPEIDANSAAASIALLSGGLLVLRGRRRKP